MSETRDKLVLPQRDPAKPSDLELDRFIAGELQGRDEARVRALIAGSPELQALVAERRAGFAADFDADAAFARIADAVGDDPIPEGVARMLEQPESAPRESPRRGLWEWLTDGWGWRGLGIGVAVAAAAVFFVVSGRGPDGRDDIVRPKSGLTLTLHQQLGAGSDIVLDGADLGPGTRLRFEVGSAEAGHLLVVGVDSKGSIGVGYPSAGGGRSAPVTAGPPRVLPGAVSLDDSLGEEWLHAIVCPEAFSVGAVAAGPAPGTLLTPEGCRVASQRYVKAASSP